MPAASIIRALLIRRSACGLWHSACETIEMRIALIAPPFIPVPPPAYGGTELYIAHLAEALVARVRKKLRMPLIDTHRGLGYRIRDEQP